MRVDTYEQAVALVNGCPYGNGSAIFTSNGSIARKFTMEVNYPMPDAYRCISMHTDVSTSSAVAVGRHAAPYACATWTHT